MMPVGESCEYITDIARDTPIRDIRVRVCSTSQELHELVVLLELCGRELRLQRCYFCAICRAIVSLGDSNS